MSVSSNSLFHFVSRREYLEDILNGDFYPRYCMEHFDFKMLRLRDVYILMKCFCDIPLSQIIEHTKMYGNYGIGFSKEWGQRQRISPMIYLYRNSNTYKNINDTFQNVLDKAYTEFVTKKTKKASKEVFDSLSILGYIKPIKGKMQRNGKDVSVIFYNEREWRFIPKTWDVEDKNELVNNFILLPKSLVDENPILLDKLHSFSKINLKIPYTADDVKYIFVENENEREYFFDLLSKSEYFDENSRKKLMCKIITTNQIKEDF